MALKGNQGKLHEDVALLFQHYLTTDQKDPDVDSHETTDGDHGRIEIRR